MGYWVVWVSECGGSADPPYPTLVRQPVRAMAHVDSQLHRDAPHAFMPNRHQSHGKLQDESHSMRLFVDEWLWVKETQHKSWTSFFFLSLCDVHAVLALLILWLVL